ncbi:hypothetical protein CTI12_AA161230 [Artemisia annua]|uniref:Uncharacterized protein n=1 Tax=Artemisia annua TaxID=35608 RepID=A0A2U1PEN8_ARTAN|nr:hypothetical protein CTI12_AA161230 [Artemisia annua]
MVSTPNFDQLKDICGSDQIKDCFKFLFVQEETQKEEFIRKVVEWSDGLHEKIGKFGEMLEEGVFVDVLAKSASVGVDVSPVANGQ